MEFNKVSIKQNYHMDINSIVVCGSPRSGTSMISGILRTMGVDMGNDYCDPDNNEDSRYLIHNGNRAIFHDNTTFTEYLEKITPLISEQNSKRLTGWKDPLSSYYIDKVYNKIEHLGAIVVYRDPLATVLGELRFRENTKIEMDFSDVLGGISFITDEYDIINDFISKFPGKLLMVSYEKALSNKEQLVNELSEFLNVKLDGDKKMELANYINPEVGTARI